MAESYFIREKKDRDYTVLCNHFIRNENLSWRAKGVMAYLLSLPDDWQIHKSEIQKHATDGRDSLTSAINELRAAGYITIKKQEKQANGQFGAVVYIVREVPLTENPSTVQPLTESQKLLSTNKQNTNKLNSLSSIQEKDDNTVEDTIPNIKTAKELEAEQSFDQALASISSSKCKESENIEKIEPKKKAKKETKRKNSAAAALEDDDFYKPIYNAYRECFFKIYPVGSIPNCGNYKKYVDSCLKRYEGLELSHPKIRELIIEAINNASNDSFVKSKNFPIAMILNESVMPRLVNQNVSAGDNEIGVTFNSQTYKDLY